MSTPENTDFELEKRIALASEKGLRMSGKNPMSQQEFDSLIASHESWLADSNSGRQLDIKGRDLFALDANARILNKAKFRNCSLAFTKFAGATFEGASISKCKLHNTDFSDATFVDSKIIIKPDDITDVQTTVCLLYTSPSPRDS